MSYDTSLPPPVPQRSDTPVDGKQTVKQPEIDSTEQAVKELSGGHITGKTAKERQIKASEQLSDATQEVADKTHEQSERILMPQSQALPEDENYAINSQDKSIEVKVVREKKSLKEQLEELQQMLDQQDKPDVREDGKLIFNPNEKKCFVREQDVDLAHEYIQNQVNSGEWDTSQITTINIIDDAVWEEFRKLYIEKYGDIATATIAEEIEIEEKQGAQNVDFADEVVVPERGRIMQFIRSTEGLDGLVDLMIQEKMNLQFRETKRRQQEKAEAKDEAKAQETRDLRKKEQTKEVVKNEVVKKYYDSYLEIKEMVKKEANNKNLTVELVVDMYVKQIGLNALPGSRQFKIHLLSVLSKEAIRATKNAR